MEMKTVSDRECGDTFISGNFPLTECDKLSGFFLKDVAEKVIPWGKEVKRYYEDK